jgi:hypothetical protein
MHRRVVRRETETAGVRGDVVDANGAGLAGNYAQEPVAVGRRADALSLGAADAAGDEALDAEVLVYDAQGGELGVGQFADAIRYQLQYTVQIQDPCDTAGGRIHGRKLFGCSPGASPRPGRPDDNLEPASALVHGEDRCRRRIQLQSCQNAIAESKVVATKADRFRTGIDQASGPQFGFRQRRRIQMEMPASKTGTTDHSGKG